MLNESTQEVKLALLSDQCTCALHEKEPELFTVEWVP